MEQSDHCFQSQLLGSLLLWHFHVWLSASIILLFPGESFLHCLGLGFSPLPAVSTHFGYRVGFSVIQQIEAAFVSPRWQSRLVSPRWHSRVFSPLFWNCLTISLFHLKPLMPTAMEEWVEAFFCFCFTETASSALLLNCSSRLQTVRSAFSF